MLTPVYLRSGEDADGNAIAETGNKVYLKEIRTPLDEAVRIAKAADVCAEVGATTKRLYRSRRADRSVPKVEGTARFRQRSLPQLSA